MEKLLQMFKDALLLSAPLYQENTNLWSKWNKYYTEVEADNNKIVTSSYVSPSFSALVTWLSQQQEKGVSLLQIYMNIDKYKREIEEAIGESIAQEFPENETAINIEQSNRNDIEINGDINYENYLEVNNSAFYYKIREGIAKNQFEEDEHTKQKTYPIQTKETSGVAKLLSHKDGDLRLSNMDEALRWTTLIDGVMSNMDDLTADCLDIITIQWLNQVQSPDEFIDFSYEQVLDMCGIPKAKANNVEYYRVEDKVKVAQRIAALASIFIYLNDKNEVVVLNDEADDSKPFEVKRDVIKRLLVLDSVVLWRDKDTNNYVGIESCRIKPGSFLSSYLYGSNATTALLSKKALEYNSYRHKYHKRLIRYLTWQWRIRQMYDNLKRPYSISGDKGLLSVMGIKQTGRSNRIREQLENVLTDLEKEKVISHWEYTEVIDEKILGKKNWFNNYYLKLGIIILPPEELMRNMENVVKKKIIDEPKEEKKIVSTDQQEQMIRDKIRSIHETKYVTMRDLSEEIGLSPATLSRFYNQKMKRLSSSVKDKLVKWYKRQEILEKM